ncbi:SPFH domain-containing protein [Nonomuraea sp. B5E05]|uniref:SPFH domain-containing protein n=1 Tax=Nonomuraea sp. B5E05 TaxID=3153569 RepID=UPI00326195A4
MLAGHTVPMVRGFVVMEPVGWALLGLLPIVVAVLWTVRVVDADERLVVHRLGRVVGVRGPGLVVVWPGVERAVRVSLRLVCLDVFCAEAVTRDGVAVRVKAGAVAEVSDPVRFVMVMDGPLAAATVVAERELRRRIAGADLADLPAMISRSGVEVAERISRATGRWGVRVTLVDVDDMQVPLRGELIAWVDRLRETRPGG